MRATCPPIFPRPRTPSTLPSSSAPTDVCQPPSRGPRLPKMASGSTPSTPGSSTRRFGRSYRYRPGRNVPIDPNEVAKAGVPLGRAGQAQDIANGVASALANRRTPPFVAQYPANPADPRRPATEDIMMIEPPPARRIAGMAYFTDRNTPSRFTAVCRSIDILLWTFSLKSHFADAATSLSQAHGKLNSAESRAARQAPVMTSSAPVM
jgi:hypothetical protein